MRATPPLGNPDVVRTCRSAAATGESVRLLTRVARRLATPDPADGAAEALDEAYVLTEELIAPAHDGTTRAGATLRVIDRACVSASGKVASVPQPADSAPTLPNSRILDAREFLSKPQAHTSCVYTYMHIDVCVHRLASRRIAGVRVHTASVRVLVCVCVCVCAC